MYVYMYIEVFTSDVVRLCKLMPSEGLGAKVPRPKSKGDDIKMVVLFFFFFNSPLADMIMVSSIAQKERSVKYN